MVRCPFFFIAFLAVKKLFLLALALVSLAIPSALCNTSFGNAVSFNDGWRFMAADSVAMSLPEYPDSTWRQLSLPHDWSIEMLPAPTLNSCTGYYPGGIGWYRKPFLTPDDGAGRHFIYFEGIYNRSEVYLERPPAGQPRQTAMCRSLTT